MAGAAHSNDRHTHEPREDNTAAEIFWAGALSGLIAETIMHPFDTVSHRAKVRNSGH